MLIHALTEDECWAVLKRTNLARLALTPCEDHRAARRPLMESIRMRYTIGT
jgi:hypothetical protein